jgi:hypothetical protein
MRDDIASSSDRISAAVLALLIIAPDMTRQDNEKRRKQNRRRKTASICPDIVILLMITEARQSDSTLEIDQTGYSLVPVCAKRSIKIHFTGRIVSASDDADDVSGKSQR